MFQPIEEIGLHIRRRMKLGYRILTSYEINTSSPQEFSPATSEGGFNGNDLQPGSHDISDKSGMAKK